MKTFFTFLVALSISATMLGQNLFVHTAMPANISADASFIDHPDLNNNPSAKILITHNWNPNSGSGVYNNNNTGVFYSNSQNKWGVYNESGASMVDGSSYNVYIGQGSDITLHIADLANQGSIDSYTIINHPDLNGNPSAQIILTTYFNPNSMRNDKVYGVWYNDTINRWIIYSEDLTMIPLDTAFFVGIQGTNVQTIKHQATPANISGNWTGIDNPLLNGNPNASFVITHNWGSTGNSSNVILDKVLGVWYTGSNWAIYTEDQSAMPQDIEFDLRIYDASLGIEDNVLQDFTLYPNPTSSQLTITAKEEISEISIYNILGQEVANFKVNNLQMNIDVSAFASGAYITKVIVGDSVVSKKFIKK